MCRKYVGTLVAIAAMMAAVSAADPVPVPGAEPAPVPVVEPAPEPTPAPVTPPVTVPVPTPEPTPAPAPTPPAAPPAAGAVQWKLSSSISTASGGTTLSLGELFFPDDEVTSKMGSATLPTGLETSPFANNESGIRVASIGKGAYTLADVIATADQPAAVADEVFTLKLTLTDVASNETGEASFVGKPTLLIGSSAGGMGELSLAIEGESSARLSLGGNQYDIRLSADESESGGYIVASVLCVHDAPEPATLVLGGIGLAGLAGARLRRRMARRNRA